MCGTVEACTRNSAWWVQSRREIEHPGDLNVGVKPFRSGVNLLACSRHLPRAANEVRERIREAAGEMHLLGTDGVIVKRRMPNGSWQ